MFTRRIAYFLDRGASIIVEVVMVVLLAMSMPFILVAAVALAVYGDVVRKRNWWTGLELSAAPAGGLLPERVDEGVGDLPRGLERKSYIKRWVIVLVGAGLIGVVEGIAAMSFQTELIFRVLWNCYGVSAAVLMVKWSTERVENVGRHGAWGLLILVPVVNILALIAFSLLSARSSGEARDEKI